MSTERSVQITLVNQTAQDLQLASSEPIHGFFVTPPPGNVPPQNSGMCKVGASGASTGIQGNITYSFQAQPSMLVTLRFDNPFLGASTYEGTVNNPAFSVATTILEGGSDASVLYTLMGP